MKTHWLEEWENEQDDKIEELEERAAILEYDGNMTRQDAEKKTLEQSKEKDLKDKGLNQ